ncbi:unnamed protein product, partial [Tilletia caries]
SRQYSISQQVIHAVDTHGHSTASPEVALASTDAEKKLETTAQEDQASMNFLLTQDEDEWDVSAAATCIGRVAACVGDAIDMPAIHFIEGSI